LFSLRGQPITRSELTARIEESGRDAELFREDTLRKAALSLLLSDGVPIAGREYPLIEQPWRTDP
jgi:hypothetical protein